MCHKIFSKPQGLLKATSQPALSDSSMKQSLVVRKKKSRHHSHESCHAQEYIQSIGTPELYLLKCALYSVTNNTWPTLSTEVIRFSTNPITVNNARGKILLMTPQNIGIMAQYGRKLVLPKTFQPKPTFWIPARANSSWTSTRSET
jgi:hypothetical protein